jgi:sugar lactone lactonase YvrE
VYRTLTTCCLAAGLALTLGGCPKKSETPVDKTADPAKPVEPTAKPAEPPARPTGGPTYVRKGLATPESVLHDAKRDLYLVANINGNPLEADGNGYICRVTPDGALREPKWIEGGKNGVTLNAPKGMAVFEDRLFVADITHVRIFHRDSGAPLGSVRIPGATFVNDLATGEGGIIYASDMGVTTGFKPSGTDAIWMFKGDDDKPKPKVLIKGKQLGQPNGLTVDGDELVVVTFGTGELYRVNKEGKRGEGVKAPKGRLDGVELLPDGDLLVSSWEAKKIFRVNRSGTFTAVVEGVEAPADIGFDRKRKRILVPLFNDNHLLFLPL